jgi:UDP-2,4-diacetamido-2,4,6-trideoxy-beta-L-altropyranose hydrolase
MPAPGVAARLVLRADADSRIGTGHVMRLLALAQAWRDQGGHVDWLVSSAPATLVSRFETEGVTVHRLPAAHPEPSDAAALVESLAADRTATAAIDGPAVDEPYLDALEPVASRVLMVDDTGLLGRYPVALVLNQNAHATSVAYPGGVRTLLGLEYVLLRREFRELAERPAAAGPARHVLVSFGGADPLGMTSRAVEAFADGGFDPGGVRATVVVGAANPAADQIERAATRTTLPITLARAVSDMASLMASADLAIVSAGSTVWELARTGVPAIVIETAPSESYLTAGLARLGLGDLLGRGERLTAAMLAAAVRRRIDDDDWRARMSELGRRLVDGRGSDRVVAALRSLTQ